MAEKSGTKDKVTELMEDPEAQAKIKEQVNAMQKLVERQMAEEEDENMKYKMKYMQQQKQWQRQQRQKQLQQQQQPCLNEIFLALSKMLPQ